MKIYQIHKGVNRPIEFRGLKAQYIGRLVMLVLGDVAGFVVLRLAGVNSYVVLSTALGLGGWSILRLYRLSNVYGQYGWMLRRARKRMPPGLISHSRKLFMHHGKRICKNE